MARQDVVFDLLSIFHMVHLNSLITTQAFHSISMLDPFSVSKALVNYCSSRQ